MTIISMAPGTAVKALLDSDGSASSLNNGGLTNMHDFYSRMRQTQDDVLSGRHERIKLPPNLLEKIAQLQAVKTSNAQQGVALPGLSSSVPAVYVQNNFYNRGIVENSASAIAGTPSTAAPSLPKPGPPTSSAFAPVLPHKAKDAGSHELKLKRQRLEHSLASQLGGRKEKGFLPEYDTSVDADKALRDALSVIRPVSGFEAADRGGESSSSLDENDYYSSQAMSWSSVESEAAAVPKPAASVVDKGTGTHDVAPGKRKAVEEGDDYDPSLSFVVDTVGQATLNPSYHPSQAAAQSDPRHQPLTAAYDDLPDEDSDDDYSPPPPDAIPTSNSNGTSSIDNLERPLQGHSGARSPDPRYEYNRSVPSAPQAVIHSRIRTPFAPQPARVSPLALGKMPSLEHQPSQLQNPTFLPDYMQPVNEQSFGQNNNTSYASRGKSPVMHTSNHTQKKRKRQPVENDASAEENAKLADKRGQNKTKREKKKERRQQRLRGQERVLETSPEPYIKPEPVSPVPVVKLTEVPSTSRQGTRYLREQDDFQIAPVNATRGRLAGLREQDYVVDERATYSYPSQPTYIRVESPNAGYVRRSGRDDFDLRRVASLQYARRPYSPSYDNGHVAMPAPPPARAIQYAYPERGREPAYIDNPRYSVVPRDRSRSPVYLDERGIARPIERVERVASPAGIMMPPPSHMQRAPTTIVEDRHGNRYFATPAPPDLPRHLSVAPQARPYDDRALRSGSVMVDAAGRASVVYEPSQRSFARDRLYLDERDQGMAPPQAQRRYPEVDRGDDLRYSYRQREYSMRPTALEPEQDFALDQRRPASRERGADASDIMPAPQNAMPPPQRRRVPAPAAIEGRSLLRYDDSDASPQQRLGSVRERGADRLAMSPGPAMRSYSVRPEPIRRYPGELAGPQGRALGRTGTAVPPEMMAVDRGRGFELPVDRYGRPVDGFVPRSGYRL